MVSLVKGHFPFPPFFFFKYLRILQYSRQNPLPGLYLFPYKSPPNFSLFSGSPLYPLAVHYGTQQFNPFVFLHSTLHVPLPFFPPEYLVVSLKERVPVTPAFCPFALPNRLFFFSPRLRRFVLSPPPPRPE